VGHEGSGFESFGATEELVGSYAALKWRRMKEIKHLALGGVGWVGKGVLLSLGLLAMLALVVVIGVLTAVVLTATALPATAVRHKRRLKGRRDRANAPEISAPREKAVAS
jgi:hypothetical protein